MKPPTSEEIALEIVTFRLREGVAETAFRSAVAATTAALAAMPGFRSRRCGRDAEGGWMDIVEWETIGDAEAAAALFGTIPAGGEFGRMLDGGSVAMRHLTVLPTGE